MSNQQVDITEIIQGCKRGERRAQELLYKKYYRSMITVCIRYTKNDDDAVEVLNNAFLKVFNNITRYNPVQGTFYTWLRVIVVRCCLDRIKLNQRRETFELTEKNDVHISPEVIDKINFAEVLRMIRVLSPSAQAVFNLYVIEGYSHKEIGKILGVSEGTSKWHLSEARKNLKELFKTIEIS